MSRFPIEISFFSVFIHAAPWQGPPAPRLQGVICSSCCCCCSRSTKNIKKNTVFSTMFMPLEEKTLVFTTFLQRQGRKSSKNTAIYTVLKRMDRNRCVLRCFFQQGALNVPQIPRFSSFFCFQVSKQTNQKHWYLQCFDKTACKKTRCFGAIFHTFSAHAPPFKKRLFFTLFFATAHPDSRRR